MHRLSAYVIVHRTQSDQTADGNRLDGERNPIGRRTETDRTADGNGRGGQLSQLHQPSKRAIYCSCLHCTNQANWQSIAAGSTAPTKQTGNLLQLAPLHQPSQQNNLLQLSQLGFAACQSKNCTNQAIKPTIRM